MKQLIIVAALISSPVHAFNGCDDPPVFAATQAMGRAALACVRTEARKLARSKETADLVASAAIAQCEQLFARQQSAVKKCGGYGLSRAVDRRARSTAKAEAIRIAVSVRAR